MDVVDALGVLGRQGGGGCHGVAAMGGDDFLVRLETAFGGEHIMKISLAGPFSLFFHVDVFFHESRDPVPHFVS